MNPGAALTLPMLFWLMSPWTFGGVLHASSAVQASAASSCERYVLTADVSVATMIDHRDGLPCLLAFNIRDREDLWAIARLRDGQLSFDLNLRDGSDGPRALYGREVYRLSLEKFGSRVKGITSVWEKPKDDKKKIGDNLAEFNRLTALGQKPEVAARQTWTGRMAASHGFGRLSIGVLDGEPGHYTTVLVNFDRPRSRRKVWRALPRKATSGTSPVLFRR